jgi:hypothetical protein
MSVFRYTKVRDLAALGIAQKQLLQLALRLSPHWLRSRKAVIEDGTAQAARSAKSGTLENAEMILELFRRENQESSKLSFLSTTANVQRRATAGRMRLFEIRSKPRRIKGVGFPRPI